MDRLNTQIPRRSIIAAIPAAVTLSGCVPGVAAAETPVMRLFREWTAARAVEETISSQDEAALDAAWDARYAIEQRLMEEPCQTQQDWMLKVCAWSYFGECGGPDREEAPQLWAEVRTLIGGVA